MTETTDPAGTPEPDTRPPEEREEDTREKYDGGDIPPAEPSESDDSQTESDE
jgi:hypothetical protein